MAMPSLYSQKDTNRECYHGKVSKFRAMGSNGPEWAQDPNGPNEPKGCQAQIGPMRPGPHLSQAQWDQWAPGSMDPMSPGPK